MKTVKKERDITWDIVRGIGILLVLVGHSGCPIILKNFIYLFHMGLFLFVSGLFIPPPLRPSENLDFLLFITVLRAYKAL